MVGRVGGRRGEGRFCSKGRGKVGKEGKGRGGADSTLACKQASVE